MRTEIGTSTSRLTPRQRAARKRALKPQSIDRAWHAILHNLRDLTDKEAAEQSGLHLSTIRNWRKGYKNGGTRYPRFDSIFKAMRGVGLQLEALTPEEVEGVHRARTIQ